MNRKVLIADDEIHILRVLELKFSRSGFEVIKATNGIDALELAKQYVPNVIITDYQMPGLVGIEFARKLSEEPTLQRIPIILLTARGFSLTREELEGTNIVEIKTKPFSPSELLSVVNTLIEGVTCER